MPVLLKASWTLHHLRALALEDLHSSASLHAVAGAGGALMFQQPFFKLYHKNANFGFAYQLMPTVSLEVTKTPGCTCINRSMANLMLLNLEATRRLRNDAWIAHPMDPCFWRLYEPAVEGSEPVLCGLLALHVDDMLGMWKPQL